jgi:hypothetical protein
MDFSPFTAPFDAIKSVIQKVVDGEEKKEPGPGDVGPTVDTKQPGVNLVSLEMSEAECKQWWGRVSRAQQRRATQEEKWDILLNEYKPIISKSGDAETVKVQQHFRNVHSKIGQIFYRSPDLVMTPDDVSMLTTKMPNPMSQPGQPPAPPLEMGDIVAVKQQVLKKKLGRDGIKANRLMDELLFDVLAWAGIGCSKLGYRAVFRPPSAQANNSPMQSMAGILPGVSAGPASLPSSPSMPVFEEWYWRRFSPKKVLWNDDLHSTRFDEDATWMGMEFYMSPKRAAAAFGLNEGDLQKCSGDDRLHKHEGDTPGEGLVHGIEIYCKASYFTDEVHPLAINQLVLIEGINDRPVVWRPSPDQDFDPMTGQLTKDSLIGFPIRVLTIRDFADSSFPLADSAFTNSEIKQLSTWRRQSVALRDAAIGKYLYDSDAITETELPKLQSTDHAWIPVGPGRLKDGKDSVVTTTAQVKGSADDYRGQQLIQNDVNETLGINSNGAGTYTSSVRSATESANVQTNMQGRMGKELARVVDHYLDGARMIDQLLMRYADQQDYVEITGQDGAAKIQVWNRQIITGKYLYDIAPDSSLMVDTAQDFHLLAQYWNLSAKSPLTNQAYVLKRMANMRGMDPSKAVLRPETIQKPEEPKGKFSLAINGADLANPLVVKLLIDNGIIKPEDAKLNIPQQPEPPEGAAEKADAISQHTASNSGGRENAPGASNFRDNQPK